MDPEKGPQEEQSKQQQQEEEDKEKDKVQALVTVLMEMVRAKEAAKWSKENNSTEEPPEDVLMGVLSNGREWTASQMALELHYQESRINRTLYRAMGKGLCHYREQAEPLVGMRRLWSMGSPSSSAD